MSLTMFNALPDHETSLRQDLARKEARIAELEGHLRAKIERIYDLEEELKAERAKMAGMAMLRVTLAPLYQALQMVFGHLDAMLPAPTPSCASS